MILRWLGVSWADHSLPLAASVGALIESETRQAPSMFDIPPRVCTISQVHVRCGSCSVMRFGPSTSLHALPLHRYMSLDDRHMKKLAIIPSRRDNILPDDKGDLIASSSYVKFLLCTLVIVLRRVGRPELSLVVERMGLPPAGIFEEVRDSYSRSN